MGWFHLPIRFSATSVWNWRRECEFYGVITKDEFKGSVGITIREYHWIFYKRTASAVKSPLRYPGGKSRALKSILPLIPKFKEFREPMVGGGSVMFALIQKYPNVKYWINDKNRELYLFWKFCKTRPKELTSEIKRLRKKYTPGKNLYRYLLSHKYGLTELQRAARFFVLNRITFSGLVESGGYSNEAYHKRFTESSIERIDYASKLLQKVKITNNDYSVVIKKPGKNVFIFLDPPYYSKTSSKLYGKNGDLHTTFDHMRFVDDIKKCTHKWLITYDNCSKINKLYRTGGGQAKWKLSEWKLQYGTNNRLKMKKAKIGNELFILNYNDV